MPKGNFVSEFLRKRTDKKLWDLRRQAFTTSGTQSGFVDYLAKPIVKKLSQIGAIHPSRRTQVDEAIWKFYGKPLVQADIAAGQRLGKIPLVGKAFKTTEEFQGSEKAPSLLRGLGKKEVLKADSFRATAPIAKAQPVVMPLAGAMYISEKLHKKKPEEKAGGRMLNPDLLRKTATAIRTLESENKALKAKNEALEKEAQATKLAVQLIQDGELDPADFTEKVAELAQGDMQITKEAMAFAKTARATDLGRIKDTPMDTHAADPLTDFLLTMSGVTN